MRLDLMSLHIVCSTMKLKVKLLTLNIYAITSCFQALYYKDLPFTLSLLQICERTD